MTPRVPDYGGDSFHTVDKDKENSYLCLSMVEEKKIEKALSSLFSGIKFEAEPKGLYDPLRYSIEVGGKRIRPRLCLTAYSIYKDSFDDSILQPAAALEVFHTFTLIHDDIMDKSPKRRGQATVWTRWNEDTAILSGDVMSIDSYRRLAYAPASVLPEALALFNRTAAQVCEGQQLDMDFEKLSEVPMEKYMQMIGLKTAVLIACSAKLGALIAGAPAEDAEKLYRYGYNLGLAFQLADDYLDVYGDEKVFGKPIGGDIVNNKKSWMLTRAFEKTDDKDRLMELMNLSVGTKAEQVSKITFIKTIYNHLELAQDAQDEIKSLTAKALEAVSGLEGYDALVRYADSLTGRTK